MSQLAAAYPRQSSAPNPSASNVCRSSCSRNSDWGHARHTQEDVDAFVRETGASGIRPNFAHARYLINLASPNMEIHQRSIDTLADAPPGQNAVRTELLFI
jgi:endonuclease IV